MNSPIPVFRTLDKRIDDRLNEILQKSLARELDDRYASADDMLYALEHYIYHSGYGPTNETLGKFIRELFGYSEPMVVREGPGGDILVDRTTSVAAAPRV